MSITGILHTGLTVRDLDRSLRFYVDLLGLKLVHTQVGDNAYTRKLVGIPDAILKAALLELLDDDTGDRQFLELIEYLQPKGVQIETRPCDNGAAHLAFRTNDCRGTYERLVAQGVSFVNPPVAITAGVNKGGYGCYLRDPDGFILEFLELPSSRKPSARA